MKKSIAIIAMSFGVTGAFAQDLTSKKGEPILPEAGDYMIGVDASPFLDYMGNFFGKTGFNGSPSFKFMNGNNMIIGKYFKDATTAYRAGIRIGLDSKTTKNPLADVTSTATFPTMPAMKEDVYKKSNTNIGLTAGIEFRKGKTRLQGFYGADVMIWGSSQKDKYTYGQNVDGTTAGLTFVNSGSNTSDFSTTPSTKDDNIATGGNGLLLAGATSGRVTERKVGNGVGFGVRAFIGAEYFILPKISIGGEFGWGVGYMTGGKTKTTVESIGLASGATNPSNASIEQTVKNGGHFVLDTDRNATSTGSLLAPSGTLRLSLHF